LVQVVIFIETAGEAVDKLQTVLDARLGHAMELFQVWERKMETFWFWS